MEDKEKVPRRDFIRLGAVAGLGVASSSVLAACGGGGGGAAQGGGKEPKKKKEQASGEPSPTSPTVEEGEPIVEAGFIPPGFAFSFNLAESGKPAVLVHLPDESWAAYEAVCTHAGCEVAYQLQSRKLGCPCHERWCELRERARVRCASSRLFRGPPSKLEGRVIPGPL